MSLSQKGKLVAAVAFAAAVTGCVFGVNEHSRVSALESELDKNEVLVDALMREVDDLKAKVKEQEEAIVEKDEAITELQTNLEELQTSRRPGASNTAYAGGVDLGVFEATAYGGGGICADGHPAQPGVLAADPSVLPYGTVVYVEFDGVPEHNGVYTVHDCGGAVVGNIIDVYMDSGHDAFGRRSCRVYKVNA